MNRIQDWAAKGTKLGVKAKLAESFERIIDQI